jgi:hypothetical protein
MAELAQMIAADRPEPGTAFARLPICHSACNIDPLSRGIGVQN